MPFNEPRECQMIRVERLQSISSRSSFGAICASLGFIIASVVSAQDDLRVVRFSPHTPANANSNIEIEFDRRMVPFGQRRITSEIAPATIEPELNCAWRWVDDRTLFCETSPGDPLRLATEYTITVLPGLMSESGSSLDQEVVHRFTTAVVELSDAEIYKFERPGTPVLRIEFNQPVRREDIEEHVFFKASEEPIGVSDAARTPVEAGPEWNSKVASFNNGVWVEYPFGEVFQHQKVNTERRFYYELGEEFDYSNIALERWLVKPISELSESTKFDLFAERVPSIFGAAVRESVQSHAGFRTLGEFEFLGVECTNPHGKYIKLDVRPRQSDEPNSEPETCRSDAGVFLRFTAPVLVSEVAQKFEVSAEDGEIVLRDGARTGDHERRDNTIGIYSPRFGVVRAPWVWRPHTKYTITDGSPDSDGQSTSTSKMRDIYGRVLRTGVNQSFQTSHLAPYVSIGNRWQRNAVLELETDSDIPVHSTNVRKIPLRYRLLGSDGKLTKGIRNLRPPALEDVRQVSPLGIREILGNKSGAVFVRASVEHDDDERLLGLVTPYNIHAKIGFFDSLIWVTDLKTGEGIRNARVEIVKGNLKTLQFVNRGVVAHTDQFGLARLPGIRRLSSKRIRLHSRNSISAVVRATGPKGMALLPLDSEFRIGWQFEYPNESRFFMDYEYLYVWGTSSQGIFRRGDTVQFKMYLRGQDNSHHASPPSGTYELRVEDPLEGTAYQTDFRPDEFGAFHGEFQLPKSAVLGWYHFVVRPRLNRLSLESIFGWVRDYQLPQWSPMRILVADIAPAPFSVSTELDQDQYGYGSLIRAKTSVRLHSGGFFSGGNGQVTIRVQERKFTPSEATALPFQFTNTYWTSEDRELVSVRALTDASGELESKVQLDVAEPAYARIWATGVVADERGRDVHSKSSYAEYFGVDRYVGFKIDSWVFKAERESEIETLAVDRSGSVVEDVYVKVTIERQVTNTAGVKSFDGTDRRDERTSWEEVHSCQGRATKTPFLCKYSPKAAGLLRISGTCVSETLRCSSVSVERTVTGPGAIVWRDRVGRGMYLALSRDKFEAGDTAQILVQNPFPKAQALVSVERYGILDYWSTTLEESLEVIEVPIKPDYDPGVYVSVVATAPRREGSHAISNEGVGAVDLGRPDFRWGTRAIAAESNRKRIAVEILTDRRAYKPREKVTIHLSAKPLTSGNRGEPIEFAVSVLDEAVLDLIEGGANYFDPHLGFARLHEHGVRNYNLLSQLVDPKSIEEGSRSGRHQYASASAFPDLSEIRANAFDLSGNTLELRTVSSFLSYWNPSILADQQGSASFGFTLPNNVTGWRILALASTPTDRFGLGQKSITAQTLTEIRAAMPNQLNARDHFNASFVVVNHMKKDRNLDVEIVATGAVKGGRAVAQERLLLPADARSALRMVVSVDDLPHVPSGHAVGEIRFEVRARDELDSDGLLHIVPVRQIRKKEFIATFGSIENGSVEETIAFPENVIESSTEIEISASPTVVGDLAPAFLSMRDYPYRSAEQSMSRALFAAHYEEFRSRLDAQLAWPNRHALIRTFLSRLSRYQASGGGFAYWIPQNRRVDFYLSAYMALGFDVFESMGYAVPEDVGTRLDQYLMEMLHEDVVPNHYSKDRTLSAQALALNALARSREKNLHAEFLARYSESMKSAKVFALANFLSAAIRTPGAESLAERVWALLLNRSSKTEETLHFEEAAAPVSGQAASAMLIPNCSVLSALVSAYEIGRDFASARDIDRLARWIRNSGGISGRNTHQSAFCLLALSDYVRTQESGDPNVQFETSMWIGEFSEERLGEKEFSAFSDSPLVLTHFVSEAEQGKQGRLRFVADGSGRVHYGARMSYAPKELQIEATRSGLGIIREYSVKQDDGWKVLDSEVAISTGDIVRVDLYLDVPATRSFVIVDDPVPGGLEPINQSLATVTETDDPSFHEYSDPRSHYHSAPFWDGFRAEGVGFHFREIGHGNVVFYSERLTARRYRLSWFGQAVASGSFQAPRARVEQMYAPEVFGTSKTFELNVGE